MFEQFRKFATKAVLTWVAFNAILLAAVMTSGCKIYLTPGIEVTVINDCKGSMLSVRTTHLKHDIDLPYGEATNFFLDAGSMSRVENPLVLVRGHSVADGKYLGSDSRNFFVSQNRVRERAWHVNRLAGGSGCGR